MSPGRHGTGVGASSHDPGGVFGMSDAFAIFGGSKIRAVGSSKWQLDSPGKVDEILDGVFQRQLLKSLRVQVLGHDAFAVVAMFHANSSSLVGLSKKTSHGVISQVDVRSIDRRLAGSLQDNGRSWACIVLGVPPVALFERS